MSASEFEGTVQAAIASSAGLDFTGFAFLLTWGVRRAAARAVSAPGAALSPGGSLFAPLPPADADAGDGGALGRRIALAASFDARRARRAAVGLLEEVRCRAGRTEMKKKNDGVVEREWGEDADPATFADPVSAAALLGVVREAGAVIEQTAWARRVEG